MCDAGRLASPRRLDTDLVAKAQRVAAQAHDLPELRMAQAVLLPGLAKLTLEQTAAVLGVGRATVARLQTRFRHPGERPPVCPRSALGGADAAPKNRRSWPTGRPRRSAASGGCSRRCGPPWIDNWAGGSSLRWCTAWSNGTVGAKWPPTRDSPRPTRRGRASGKKTLPENLAAVLTAAAVPDRPIRLRFQAEARFGRMARRRRCWAPAPLRPTVRKGYEREFPDVYGAGARRGTPPR